MRKQEAMAIAKEVWEDNSLRIELASILIDYLGDPLEPNHPIMDLAEDYLTQELEYSEDPYDELWDNKMALTEALVRLMARAVKNGR